MSGRRASAEPRRHSHKDDSADVLISMTRGSRIAADPAAAHGHGL